MASPTKGYSHGLWELQPAMQAENVQEAQSPVQAEEGRASQSNGDTAHNALQAEEGRAGYTNDATSDSEAYWADQSSCGGHSNDSIADSTITRTRTTTRGPTASDLEQQNHASGNPLSPRSTMQAIREGIRRTQLSPQYQSRPFPPISSTWRPVRFILTPGPPPSHNDPLPPTVGRSSPDPSIWGSSASDLDRIRPWHQRNTSAQGQVRT